MSYRSFLIAVGSFAEGPLPARKRAASRCFLLALLLAAATAQAADLKAALQQHARQTLTRYAQQRGWELVDASYAAWLPDSAARLPACPQPLRIAPARADAAPWGRLAYTISCGGRQPWSVRGRVDVQAWLMLWSARADLPAHRELGAEDMVPRRTEVSRLRHFSVQQEDLLGLRTQRRVRAGQLLAAAELAPKLAVHKGETVLIQASRGGFSASARGEALADASAGAPVRVRNLLSGAEIQAWASAPGVVETRF